PPSCPCHRTALFRKAAAAAPCPRSARIRATREGDAAAAATTDEGQRPGRRRKRCLRCGALYLDVENSRAACAFHGHITGRWNDRGDRPNTGRENWKGRWSCCHERDEEAPPCRRGYHVSYDDGFTLLATIRHMF
ncbi:hypothetical protein ZWY2020_038164, partial [Hordeum vulgare]